MTGFKRLNADGEVVGITNALRGEVVDVRFVVTRKYGDYLIEWDDDFGTCCASDLNRAMVFDTFGIAQKAVTRAKETAVAVGGIITGEGGWEAIPYYIKK